MQNVHKLYAILKVKEKIKQNVNVFYNVIMKFVQPILTVFKKNVTNYVVLKYNFRKTYYSLYA